MSNFRTRATACLLPAVLAGTLGGHMTARSPDRDNVAAIRRATARYRDVRAALRDGYVRDPMDMCVTPAMEGLPEWLGAMGVHYFRPDILGITATSPRVNGTGTNTDFTRPGVLIYEPQPGGSLKLVAVENLVFEQAWRDAGHREPPALAGHQYFRMVDNPLTSADEAHGFEPHYELHVWTERRNPAGPFMEFNRAVTCKHHAPRAAS
jgi:hypothetical protein